MFKYLTLSVLFCCSLMSCKKKVPNWQPDLTPKKIKEPAKSDLKTPNTKPEKAIKLFMGFPGASRRVPTLEKLLSEKSGFEIEFISLDSSTDVLNAMKKDKVQIVFGDAWLYLASHHLADGTLLAVAEHEGKTKKEAAWFTQAGTTFGFEKLAKRKIVFSTPTDLAGYLFPYQSLVTKGVLKKGKDINKGFSSVLFAGSADAVLQDLLAERADAGPVFLEDYQKLDEAKQKKLKVLLKLEAVPNDCFFARSGTKLSVLHKVRDTLIEISKTHEGAALLQGVYGVRKLVKSSHSDHVNAIEAAQTVVGHEYPFAELSENLKPQNLEPKK